jgi:hypothetical protein
MPNFDRRGTGPADDLEIASRVMDTVQRQIASHRLSLEKLRLLRQELAQDSDLAARLQGSPEMMSKLLVERGIPEPLAMGMVAEDFQDQSLRGVGFWTWDCCCTACCLTQTICHCTYVTSIGAAPKSPVGS